MRKKSSLTAMDSVLKDVARDLHFEDRLEQVMLYRLWQEAVGEAVARNACPALVRGGVLHVNVSSAVWVQELQFLRGMLLEKINAGLGGEKIRDIRFKIGPVASPVERHTGAVSLPELGEEEKRAVDAEAARIGDPELRRAFQELMAAHVKNRKTTE